MEEMLILVDQNDQPIGVEEKLAAHRKGKLHRAFSVFVFNSRGELLLQKRAQHKYHSGGAWTCACDGHPRPGELTIDAARRRLEEEMGFDCHLEEALHFTYRTELDNDLIEHEYDYILVGRFDGEPTPDPEEASDWKWISQEALKKDLQKNPERYASWFKIAIERGLLSHVSVSEDDS
jgi:isopentenyl-diphosphate delta-isomerase